MVAFITMWDMACPYHGGVLAQWPAKWFFGEVAEGATGTSVLHHCIGGESTLDVLLIHAEIKCLSRKFFPIY